MIVKQAILFSDRIEFQLEDTVKTFTFSIQYNKFSTEYVFEKSFYKLLKSIHQIEILCLSPELTPYYFNISIPYLPAKKFLSLVQTNYIKPLRLEKGMGVNYLKLNNKNNEIFFELLVYREDLIQFILRLFSNYSIRITKLIPLIVNMKPHLHAIAQEENNFYFYEAAKVLLIFDAQTSNYVLFSLPESNQGYSGSAYSSIANQLFSIFQIKPVPYMKQSGPSLEKLQQCSKKDLDENNIYRFFKKRILRHNRVFSGSILLLIIFSLLNVFMIIKNDSLIKDLQTKYEQKFIQSGLLATDIAQHNQFRQLKKKAYRMVTENQIISQFIGKLPELLPSPIKIVKLEYQYKYVTRFERFKKTIRIHGNSVRDHMNWEKYVTLAIENMRQFLPEARIFLANGFYSDNSQKGLFTIEIELETKKFEYE